MAPPVCASCGAKLEGGRRSADGRLVCGRCGRVVTSLSGNGSKLKPVRVGAPLAPPPRRAAGARSPSPTAAARAPVVAPAVGQSSRDAVVGDTRTESPKRGRTRGAAPSETSSTAVASPDRPSARRTAGVAGGAKRVKWLWRGLAWIVAIPAGLVIVGLPAKDLGYLTRNDLADVLLKSDLDRFLPLVIVVALWALVTAALVHLFVEGGRWWSARRSQRKSVDVRVNPITSGPVLEPPRRRRPVDAVPRATRQR